jgi:hypothetical protein
MSVAALTLSHFGELEKWLPTFGAGWLSSWPLDLSVAARLCPGRSRLTARNAARGEANWRILRDTGLDDDRQNDHITTQPL